MNAAPNSLLLTARSLSRHATRDGLVGDGLCRAQTGSGGHDLRGGEHRWSSAVAHLTGAGAHAILDMEWWFRESPGNWAERLGEEDEESVLALRTCTYSGQPFGEQGFVEAIAKQFGRYWKRGRPPKQKQEATQGQADAEQFALF